MTVQVSVFYSTNLRSLIPGSARNIKNNTRRRNIMIGIILLLLLIINTNQHKYCDKISTVFCKTCLGRVIRSSLCEYWSSCGDVVSELELPLSSTSLSSSSSASECRLTKCRRSESGREKVFRQMLQRFFELIVMMLTV
jgi:hypothetical protein